MKNPVNVFKKEEFKKNLLKREYMNVIKLHCFSALQAFLNDGSQVWRNLQGHEEPRGGGLHPRGGKWQLFCDGGGFGAHLLHY